MTDPRTLLQRLHDSPARRPSDDDEALLIASVLHNLDQVLGTVRGSSMLDPDYGFPTMSEFAYSMPLKTADDPMQPYIQDLKRHLLKAIERYEPRLAVSLEGITVVYDRRDPTVLGFQVRGRLLRGRGGELSYSYGALLGQDGGWDLSGSQR